MPPINTNPATLTPTQTSAMIGGLLGDSSLTIRKDSINPRMTIRRQSQDIDYLRWEFDIFKNCCRDKAITTGKTYDARYDKTYPYCNLETRYIPAFLPFYELWYPFKKKRVPASLKLDALSIAVWFCDDCHIRIQGTQRINTKFHTQGFLKDEVAFLCDLLNNRYNVVFHLQKSKKDKEQYTIVGADHASREMLKDIDAVFPAAMSRKSDKWRDPAVHFYHDEPRQYLGNKGPEIKNQVIERLKQCESFTIKSLCQDTGNNSSYNGTWLVNSTIKNFIVKNIANGAISMVEPVEVLSCNTLLYLNGIIVI